MPATPPPPDDHPKYGRLDRISCGPPSAQLGRTRLTDRWLPGDAIDVPWPIQEFPEPPSPVDDLPRSFDVTESDGRRYRWAQTALHRPHPLGRLGPILPGSEHGLPAHEDGTIVYGRSHDTRDEFSLIAWCARTGRPLAIWSGLNLRGFRPSTPLVALDHRVLIVDDPPGSSDLFDLVTRRWTSLPVEVIGWDSARRQLLTRVGPRYDVDHRGEVSRRPLDFHTESVFSQTPRDDLVLSPDRRWVVEIFGPTHPSNATVAQICAAGSEAVQWSMPERDDVQFDAPRTTARWSTQGAICAILTPVPGQSAELSLHGVDAAAGEERWSMTLPGDTRFDPEGPGATWEIPLLIPARDGHVRRTLHPGTGETLDERPTDDIPARYRFASARPTDLRWHANNGLTIYDPIRRREVRRIHSLFQNVTGILVEPDGSAVHLIEPRIMHVIRIDLATGEPTATLRYYDPSTRGIGVANYSWGRGVACIAPSDDDGIAHYTFLDGRTLQRFDPRDAPPGFEPEVHATTGRDFTPAESAALRGTADRRALRIQHAREGSRLVVVDRDGVIAVYDRLATD